MPPRLNPSAILEVRMKAIQRQLNNIRSFVTQPTGIFETIDSIIKTARYANRETLRMLGINAQAIYKVTEIRMPAILQNLRRRLGR